MQCTTITVTGEQTKKSATITRHSPELVHVVIDTGDRKINHTVWADDEQDIASMASCLQHMLDGYKGTNGDVHSYRMVLDMIAA